MQEIDRLLSIKDLSGLLRRGKSALWDDVKAGRLPQPVKLGGSTRWKYSEVQKFIQELAK